MFNNKNNIKPKLLTYDENAMYLYNDLLDAISNIENIDDFYFKVINTTDKTDNNEYYYINGALCYIDTENSRIRYLKDLYENLDKLILGVFKCSKPDKSDIAVQNIIEELEDLYMDLNMDIDNCQGCMTNLDSAFKQLELYKELVGYLGGELDKDLDIMMERWHDRMTDGEIVKENLTNGIRTTINFPDDLYIELDTTPRMSIMNSNDTEAKISELNRAVQCISECLKRNILSGKIK